MRWRRVKIIGALLLAPAIAALALISVFWASGDPLRQWDEAALALNAFEMLQRGAPFNRHLGGELDFTNTKPPLAIWLTAGSIHLLGPTEFAVRLPSAIASLVMLMVVWLFGMRVLKDHRAAFASVLILLTSVGFLGEHVARGGDYDALLVLFTTSTALAAFVYAQNGSVSWLAAASASFSLALLTKGIAAILPIPGLIIYYLFDASRRRLLFQWRVAAAGLLSLVPLGITYFTIELHQPGFFGSMLLNEFGRFGSFVPGAQPRGFFFYLIDILAYKFVPWIYVLPIALLLKHPFSRFAAIYLTFFLLTISLSTTKHHWYDAPFYPVAAICTGLLLAKVSRAAFLPRLKYVLGATIVLLFGVAIHQNIYLEIVKNRMPFRLNNPEISRSAERYKKFLSSVDFDTLTLATGIYVLNGYSYNTPLLWTVSVASARSGHHITTEWVEPSRKLPLGHGYVVYCHGPDSPAANPLASARSLHRDGAGCELAAMTTRSPGR